MEIRNFIKIYDEILPWKVLSNLIRFLNTCSFEEAKVGADDHERVDFTIRKVHSLPLHNMHNSFSNVHWHNLLYNKFNDKLLSYKNDLNIIDFGFSCIKNIDVLKYENTGFYTWHVDHFASIPRTMSCIFLLNNDYEGGSLCYRNPDGSQEFEIDVRPNRMILWPSNFLYPHTVKPVTKGTRYSVVAWAL